MDIGFIGLGDVGKAKAKQLAQKGYSVYGCDLPERRGRLEEELQGSRVTLLDKGNEISRRCDVVFYAVEAENIASVVEQYAPATRAGAIVAGLTSVKTPEVLAFERHVPRTAHIALVHDLYAPSVRPIGQTTAVIPYRVTPDAYARLHSLLETFGSSIIQLPDYQTHDKITADTQAVTHIGFESIGTAWKRAEFFPWENPSYTGGIDNYKILMTLRIYGGKSHVFCGLATLNPYVPEQVGQYDCSTAWLFKRIVREEGREFKQRIERAGNRVFGSAESPIMLDDAIMGEFSLGNVQTRKPNSHLSLLAMVDAWSELGICPYKNLLCQTPIFRLRLGIAEYLFRNPELLQESIETALGDRTIRGDDFEFCTAVHEWSSLVCRRETAGYKEQFDETKEFLKDRIPEGMKKSGELIARLASTSL